MSFSSINFEQQVEDILPKDNDGNTVTLTDINKAKAHLENSIQEKEDEISSVTNEDGTVVNSNINKLELTSGIWRGTLLSSVRGTKSIEVIIDKNHRINIITETGKKILFVNWTYTKKIIESISKGKNSFITTIDRDYTITENDFGTQYWVKAIKISQADLTEKF